MTVRMKVKERKVMGGDGHVGKGAPTALRSDLILHDGRPLKEVDPDAARRLNERISEILAGANERIGQGELPGTIGRIEEATKQIIAELRQRGKLKKAEDRETRGGLTF